MMLPLAAVHALQHTPRTLSAATLPFAAAAAARAASSTADSLIHTPEFPSPGVRVNELSAKPRASGLTEIRGPYYTPLGPTHLRELLQGVGHAVDGLKFAGGSFRVMRREAVKQLIQLRNEYHDLQLRNSYHDRQVAHEHNVYVSTGGWMEYVLTQGPDAVRHYLHDCKALGFDVIELSTGFISLPDEDLLRLIRQVQNAGMQAKPEIGVQLGAGGASGAAALVAQGTVDPDWAVARAARCLQEADVPRIMVESEGITEDVEEWRTDVAAKFVRTLGLDRVMFEASDPAVFSMYVQSYGPHVNLFVDHSQAVQLECLRRGIWGTTKTWGRVLTHKGE